MAPTRSLEVTTLNVWGLPAPAARDGVRRARAIAHELAERTPDIACFQEVWTTEWRSALLAAGDATGYGHHWHREPSLGGSGLLVLSTLPIRRAHFTPFRWSAPPERIDQLDYFGQKGFVVFEVESPAGVVTIVNTHLQAAYDNDRNRYAEVRAIQWLQLAAAVAAVTTPLIVCGDLNIAARTPEAQLLTDVIGLRDSAVEMGAARPTAHSKSPYREPDRDDARIDYLLSRPGNGAMLSPKHFEHCFNSPLQDGQKAGRPSDHDGLCARFEWQPETAISRPSRASAAALALLAQHLESAEQIVATRRRNRWLAGAASGAGALAAQRARAQATPRRTVLRHLLALAGVASLGVGGLFIGLAEQQISQERAALAGARADMAAVTR